MLEGKFTRVPAWSKFALDGEGILYMRVLVPASWMPLQTQTPHLSPEEMQNKCPEVTFYDRDPRAQQ